MFLKLEADILFNFFLFLYFFISNIKDCKKITYLKEHILNTTKISYQSKVLTGTLNRGHYIISTPQNKISSSMGLHGVPDYNVSFSLVFYSKKIFPLQDGSA